MGNKVETQSETKPAPLVATNEGEYAALLDTSTFGQLQRAANIYASSSLVPDTFQGNLPNCFVALQMAIRLEMDPFMLMQNMYVVHGKPGMEAKLMISLANERGPFAAPISYTMTGSGDTRSCTARATMAESGETVEATVDMALAKKMGWTSKKDSMWLKMPEQMLRYRSAAWLIRTVCPEVILGMHTKDELHDMRDDFHGAPVDSVSTIEALLKPAPEPQPAVEPTPPDSPESKPTTPDMAQLIDEYTQAIEAAVADTIAMNHLHAQINEDKALKPADKKRLIAKLESKMIEPADGELFPTNDETGGA